MRRQSRGEADTARPPHRRRALPHWCTPRHTLNMMPAMVVPVLVNPGPFTPCFSKKSFRLHRSKTKPPSSAAAMAGNALLVRSGGDKGEQALVGVGINGLSQMARCRAVIVGTGDVHVLWGD